MFVFSFKTSKRNIGIWSGVLVCFLFIGIFLFGVSINKTTSVTSVSNPSVKVSDNKDRIEFLSKFGWQVEEEPIEISEITIPADFNETYKKYNEMQKSQDFNLEKYKGKVCTRFTYKVLNYKDKKDSIVANLLVLNNKIIGGEITSTELDGFMHGFKKPDEAMNGVKKTEWNPELKKNKKYNIEKTTYKNTLDPDKKMPQAPTD